MHYKNGEPAAVGHVVKGEHYNSPKCELLGAVVATLPGADTCNLYVAPLAFLYGEGERRVVLPAASTSGTYSLTAGKCERVA
jgi:hypothetical protein